MVTSQKEEEELRRVQKGHRVRTWLEIKRSRL